MQLFFFSGKVVGHLSNKGWSTVETMIKMLDDVIFPASKGRLCVLVLDCFGTHMADDVIARRPAVVVTRSSRYATGCQRHLEQQLLDSHYEREMVTTRERRHRSFHPQDHHAWVIRWSVFTDARR